MEPQLKKTRPARRKGIKKPIKMGLLMSLSVKRAEYIKSITKAMGVTRGEVFFLGIEKLLELISEVESNIYIGNYVVAYYKENKSGNALRGGEREIKNGTKVYVYDIHKSARMGYLCFCKENDDPTDLNFKVLYIGPHFISKRLVEKFPQTYKDLLPK